MEIQPNEERLEGEGTDFRIAGVVFSGFDFGIVARGLRGRTGFTLENAASLQQTLASFWPEGLKLDELEGEVTLNSAENFKDLTVTVAASRLDGSWQGNDFTVADLSASYGETLKIEPFSAGFSGLKIDVSQATTRMAARATAPGVAVQQEPFDLSIHAKVSLEDYRQLAAFMALPEDLAIAELSLQASLFSDIAFEDPRISFSVTQLDATYAGNPLRTDNLAGLYHKGLWPQIGGASGRCNSPEHQ